MYPPELHVAQIVKKFGTIENQNEWLVPLYWLQIFLWVQKKLLVLVVLTCAALKIYQNLKFA